MMGARSITRCRTGRITESRAPPRESLSSFGIGCDGKDGSLQTGFADSGSEATFKQVMRCHKHFSMFIGGFGELLEEWAHRLEEIVANGGCLASCSSVKNE